MSFMRRVNPGYIECLISEMQNLTDRMDEIIERDWKNFSKSRPGPTTPERSQ